MERINVTKPFLPPIEEYQRYIEQIWSSEQLTNNGACVCELNRQLKEYLDVSYIRFVCNGTLALMLAIDALGLEDCEIITTPFTYIATTSSIIWQKCKPVFADILPDTLCIDPAAVESLITPRTKAILAVHVFGIPCDVEALDTIAKKHDLKIIYDAAHAFSVKYKGKSILRYGDISTLSFHSTKLYHTIEGGAVSSESEELYNIYEKSMRFGHNGDDHILCGINAKNSEFHAAMGLANLKHIDHIISARKKVCEHYDKALSGRLKRPSIPEDTEYNYAYYPVIFDDEEALLRVCGKLNAENIFPRRYFYPSINDIAYTPDGECPVSSSVSRRIICLPLFTDIPDEAVEKIAEIILEETER